MDSSISSNKTSVSLSKILCAKFLILDKVVWDVIRPCFRTSENPFKNSCSFNEFKNCAYTAAKNAIITLNRFQHKKKLNFPVESVLHPNDILP